MQILIEGTTFILAMQKSEAKNLSSAIHKAIEGTQPFQADYSTFREQLKGLQKPLNRAIKQYEKELIYASNRSNS